MRKKIKLEQTYTHTHTIYGPNKGSLESKRSFFFFNKPKIFYLPVDIIIIRWLIIKWLGYLIFYIKGMVLSRKIRLIEFRLTFFVLLDRLLPPPRSNH